MDRHEHKPLTVMFTPRSVAVIGATERVGSLGRTAVWNLLNNPFGGVVYPINPKRHSVLGIKAYPSLAAVGEPVDLVVIAVPAEAVPTAVAEAVANQARGAVVISAGFQERGEEGERLQAELTAVLPQSNSANNPLRLIGPNSWGIMLPHTNLNASVARGMARPGSVAFISQSGAICSAILDWSLSENVGFSAFISVGSLLDVQWAELLYLLEEDPHTQSIVMYMETIGDARAFMSAARQVALSKPILLIKPGQTAEASRAVLSHTGALTAADEVITAVFQRCGVLRVAHLSDLFHMAETLSQQPRPSGQQLSIITNAGGPAVLATDALILGGGTLAPLASHTQAALRQLLPPQSAPAPLNPVDLHGDATPEMFRQAMQLLLADETTHALLVILTPQGQSDPLGTAEALVALRRQTSKPVLAVWMGGEAVAPAIRVLNQAHIPTFAYPDTAAQIFNYLWQYYRNIQSLYETPQLPDDTAEVVAAHGYAQQLLQEISQSGRTLLTEYEAKVMLAAYGLPTVDTRLAYTAQEAVDTAVQIGYPVVLKLHSPHHTHKSSVGGVWLDLRQEAEVRHAFHTMQSQIAPEHFAGVSVQPFINPRGGLELLIGSTVDPDFGPVLLFGAGGSHAELIRDRAVALPPLNTTLARRLMERTRVFAGVQAQGEAVVAQLERVLVAFSQLVVENRRIKEVEMNPLLVREGRLWALDARLVLYDTAVADTDLPQLAIRPYPKQYCVDWVSKTGLPVHIRPIRPEDEPLLVEFHKTLSDHTIYLRYFQMLNLNQRTAHERLLRLCFIDYDREMALVAEIDQPQTGQKQIIGVGRLTKIPNSDEAEFATLISDDYHGQGLGTKLLNQLIEIAHWEKIGQIMAYTLPENRSMKHLFAREGFQFSREDGMIKAVLRLSPS